MVQVLPTGPWQMILPISYSFGGIFHRNLCKYIYLDWFKTKCFFLHLSHISRFWDCSNISQIKWLVENAKIKTMMIYSIFVVFDCVMIRKLFDKKRLLIELDLWRIPNAAMILSQYTNKPVDNLSMCSFINKSSLSGPQNKEFDEFDAFIWRSTDMRSYFCRPYVLKYLLSH